MPHARQRPRKAAKETSGTLSCQAIALPQPGHAEPGRHTLRPSGTRAMTTFRKLPINRPATTNAATIMISAAPSGNAPGGRKAGRRECSDQTASTSGAGRAAVAVGGCRVTRGAELERTGGRRIVAIRGAATRPAGRQRRQRVQERTTDLTLRVVLLHEQG